MKSKGLVVLYTLLQLSSSRNLSASCTRSTRIERSKLPSSRSPSFLEISSLLKLRTRIRPRFFSQKMTTELPDKMPNPHQPLGAGCVVRVDSLERPLRLLHDCGEGLYGVEELDVQALHLTRDVLRHYLEAVEASRLLNLDLYNVTTMLGINLCKFNFRASKLGFLMAIKIVY